MTAPLLLCAVTVACAYLSCWFQAPLPAVAACLFLLAAGLEASRS